ncbi:MAG: anti-sigma factor [Cytophagales bacterium]|nr:anti-sigma factor [Cytophagales bacterium]
MNKNEIIESGLLELYVLDMASKEECVLVEKMVNEDEAVKQELLAIQAGIESLSLITEQKPDANLKNKIFDKYSEKEQQEAHMIELISHKAQTILDQTLPNFWNHPYTIAATYLILASSVFFAYKQYDSRKSAEQALTEYKTKTEYLSLQNTIYKTNYEKINIENQILAKPGNKVIQLSGTPNAPDAIAIVCWNTNTGEVNIKIKNIPELPSQKQYQLWAMVNGKPIDAGLIPLNLTNNLVINMKPFANAQAFAISLEQVGGSAVPDMQQIFLMGNV